MRQSADGYRTCPDDWKFFLKTDLYASGCFGLGWLVLIPALTLDSITLAPTTSALRPAWVSCWRYACAGRTGGSRKEIVTTIHNNNPFTNNQKQKEQ